MGVQANEKQLAFARQAASDLEVFWLLTRQAGLAKCHRLHYLQMFMEKLCKAYCWTDAMRHRRPIEIETSHAMISKTLPKAYEQFCLSLPRPFQPSRGALARIRNICQEIERLAPSVDAVNRPDNCEYPWELPSGQVIAPSEHTFPLAQQLRTPAGGRLLTFSMELLSFILPGTGTRLQRAGIQSLKANQA